MNDLPTPTETDLLDAIEVSIRATTKAYGYQHLSVIGNSVRQQFPHFQPANYGCKTLLQFIERYPERFKMKWPAPAHKGRSHVWVRLSAEPKRKEGYAQTNPQSIPSKPAPRLMTAAEFSRLCDWLSKQSGCDGTLRKTRRWLRRRDFLGMESNVKLLKQLGGYCDCEVLLNVVDQWSRE